MYNTWCARPTVIDRFINIPVCSAQGVEDVEYLWSIREGHDEGGRSELTFVRRHIVEIERFILTLISLSAYT